MEYCFWLQVFCTVTARRYDGWSNGNLVQYDYFMGFTVRVHFVVSLSNLHGYKVWCDLLIFSSIIIYNDTIYSAPIKRQSVV